MTSLNIGLTYNAEERLKTIMDGIREDFQQEKIDKILEDAIKKSTESLPDIQKDIDELEKNVNSIRSDGTEDKYLIYEDKCRKLLTKLDAIVVNSEDDKQLRKKLIERINGFTSKLKDSSVDNLRQLLFTTRKLDVNKKFETTYSEVEGFLTQSSSGSTITQVDDQRFKLEEIKQKLNQKDS